jgi:uncharacterized protein YdhG (YjbR/CyaY superfamily)
MKRAESVEAYISAAPRELQGKLKELRRVIRTTAPDALEKISYGMPYYGYKGRLAYFALAKNHIGVYIPPPIIAEYKRELKGYETARATVRFPLEKKLPLGLIRKMIKARMILNEAKK